MNKFMVNTSYNDGEINFIKMSFFLLCMQSFGNRYLPKLNMTHLHFNLFIFETQAWDLCLVQNIYFVNPHCFQFVTVFKSNFNQCFNSGS